MHVVPSCGAHCRPMVQVAIDYGERLAQSSAAPPPAGCPGEGAAAQLVRPCGADLLDERQLAGGFRVASRARTSSATVRPVVSLVPRAGGEGGGERLMRRWPSVVLYSRANCRKASVPLFSRSSYVSVAASACKHGAVGYDACPHGLLGASSRPGCRTPAVCGPQAELQERQKSARATTKPPPSAETSYACWACWC